MLKSARTIIFLFAPIFGIAAVLGTDAHAAGCEPSPNEVTLFQHGNYRGACSVLSIGQYPDSAAMHMKNDSVSSIKVGSNVEVYVSKHSFKRGNTSLLNRWKGGVQWSGPVQIFTQSQPSLSGTRVGNDSISSVTVQARTAAKIFEREERGDCYPGENSQSIAIYQHEMFKGNCRVLDLGTYRDSKALNFKNDSVSSVEIGDNSTVYVELYSGSNFKGRTQTLRNSAGWLSTGAVGDNKLTSIKVLRR